ncbi:MAG: hypothetical protein GX970_14160 [Phyllobacteriaceae bacterium]|nr:hypothetical protein [Paracoccus thiocyanatus]NMA99225.1 hypothetical protein [Phyllobacteriaceae bacterium]
MAFESALQRLVDRCIRSATMVDRGDQLGQVAALVDTYIDWAVDHPGVFLALCSASSAEIHERERIIALDDRCKAPDMRRPGGRNDALLGHPPG